MAGFGAECPALCPFKENNDITIISRMIDEREILKVILMRLDKKRKLRYVAKEFLMNMLKQQMGIRHNLPKV